MAVEVACTPAAPVHGSSACRFDVTGASTNDATAYNAALYPSEPAFGYYLKFVVGGVEKGRSYVFNVGSDGAHIFNNYTFPSAGSWTVTLNNASTDAEVATVAVTVS